MAFSYLPGSVGREPLHFARLILDDRMASESVFQDEEILGILAAYPGDLREALASLAAAAYIIAASRASSMTNGDRRVAWDDRAKGFAALSERIRSGSLPLPLGGSFNSSIAGETLRPDLSKYKSD